MFVSSEGIAQRSDDKEEGEYSDLLHGGSSATKLKTLSESICLAYRRLLILSKA